MSVADLPQTTADAMPPFPVRRFTVAEYQQLTIVDLNTLGVDVFANPDRASGRYTLPQRLIPPAQASFALTGGPLITLSLQDVLPTAGTDA